MLMSTELAYKRYSQGITRTITGTYGGSQTPCTIYVYGDCYVVEGSVNCNWTNGSLLVDGVDVETLEDYDTMSADDPIYSCEDLEREVEEC